MRDRESSGAALGNEPTLALMIDRCESPAEEAFVRGWFEMAEEVGWPMRELLPNEPGWFGALYPDGRVRYIVIPQCRALEYRLDFFFIPRPHLPRMWNGYAVEIDGHAWHERTARDAAYQRRRDRRLMHNARVLTVRFAACEVLRDPMGVAYECEATIEGAFCEDGWAAQDGQPTTELS